MQPIGSTEELIFAQPLAVHLLCHRLVASLNVLYHHLVALSKENVLFNTFFTHFTHLDYNFLTIRDVIKERAKYEVT